MRYMPDSLFMMGPRLQQARGAVALVSLTLMVALPVAVVYGDIQVVALLLGDGGVRERLGDSGQAGAAFWQRCGGRFGRPSFGLGFGFGRGIGVATVLRDQWCISIP